MADLVMEHFRCGGEVDQGVSEEICRRAGVAAEKVFSDGFAAAAAAKAARLMEADSLCKLPFAYAAEGEALGASWQLGSQPVPGLLPYRKLEEVRIRDFDFDSGLLKEMLQAVKLLKEQGETVCFKLEGPFTLLGLLIPSQEIYRSMRKKPGLLEQICDRLTRNIAAEAAAAVRAGAELLSYADPLAAGALISPQLYASLCGRVTEKTLQVVAEAAPGAVIHVCSATSACFEKAGFCQSRACKVPPGMGYGRAICFAHRQTGAHIVGHGCLQQSGRIPQRPVVYELQLRKAAT